MPIYHYLLLLGTGLLVSLSLGCGSVDPSEDTPFLRAVRQGKRATAEALLAEDPSLLTQKTQQEGLTPLHIAARHHQPELVSWLIEQGAAVNATDQKGWTPLHHAAYAMRHQDASSILLLLEAGADPSLTNAKGRDVWAYLLHRDRFRLQQTSGLALGFLLRYGYQPPLSPDKEGQTILHRLAQRCPVAEPIERLIDDQGLDPNQPDQQGWTPLHHAAKGRNYAAAEVLLEHGADASALTTQDVGRQSSGQVSGREIKKGRYRFPAGSTPLDVYRRAGPRARNEKSLRPLLESYR